MITPRGAVGQWAVSAEVSVVVGVAMSRAVPTTERTRLVPKGSKSLPKQSFVPPPKIKKTQQAREYLPPFLVRDTRVQWKKKRGKGAQVRDARL